MRKSLIILTQISLSICGFQAVAKPHNNEAFTESSHQISGMVSTGHHHKMMSDDTAFAVNIHGIINNGVREPWKTYRHSITDISDRTLIGEFLEENLRPRSLAWNADKSALYGISREDQQTKLLTFDPQSGVSTTVAVLSGYPSDVQIFGMTIDQNNQCFVTGLDRANHDTITSLFSCDLSTGQLTFLGSQSTAPDIHDIVATCDGSLYGVDAFQTAFYRLSKTDGSAELVGPMGFSSAVNVFNMTYDRKRDRIIQYVNPETEFYFTAMAEIDRQSGEATFIDDEYLFGTYVGASESSCDEQEVAFDINTAFNGSWFNPVTDGQGFVFDVLPDSDVFYAAWFTFSDQAGGDEAEQRWMTASGPLGSGNSVQLTVYNTTGGAFDAAAAVQSTVTGSMEITFDDCATGEVSYNLNAGELTGSFNIQRIAGDQVAYCESLINAGIR
jgi:hypothetical protein